MMLRSTIKYGLLGWLIIGIGCATTGMLTTGMTTLSIIDGFYHTVIDKKANPATLHGATLILQQADALAQMAKAGKDTPAMVAQATLLTAQADKLTGK